MSILLSSIPLPTLPPFSSSSSTLPPAASPVSRLQWKSVDLHVNGVRFQRPIIAKKPGSFIVKASADVDGPTPSESKPPVENDGKVVSVEKLPLESKLQERMEQKLKMKLARKIRLRRKRLVRKRRMRKKGRWPPSKMKKLKNV